MYILISILAALAAYFIGARTGYVCGRKDAMHELNISPPPSAKPVDAIP